MLATCKRAEYLLLILVSLPLASPASDVLQPARIAPIQLDQSAPRTTLAGGAEVACDPHGDMPLEAAQTASYSALLHQMPTSPECHGYWVRFAVEASSVPPGGWLLEFPAPWRHADLHAVSETGVSTQQSGVGKPPQDRALASADMAIPLPLAAGPPRAFYLHVTGDTTPFGESRFLALYIIRLDHWVLLQRSLLFGQGIYAGIIAGLALYNLILFLAIQERVYLYYVLYVVSFGSVWIARTGFFFQFLWPRQPRWDEDYLAYLASAAIVFSIFFVREFLSTRTRLPRTDMVMRGLAILTVLACFAGLAGNPSWLALPLAILALGVTLLYAGIGLVTLFQGYRPARFFLLAWAALLAGNLVYLSMFLRIIPLTFFTYNAAQAGSAIECILLAFALADRVNLLKRVRDERQLQYTRELREQVNQRTGELSDAVERLKTASVTDPLTGLSNRRHVDAAIQPWIADLQRARIRKTPGEPLRSLAVCLADLDHFKQVNDELGHAVGDRVLRAAAESLRQNVRATAILARWGGEEFLILDHVNGPYDELLMAERLRRSIVDDSSPVIAESGRPLSLSLGVGRYPFSEAYPELLDWDHCLALADHALYGAKKAGRNRWQCYRSNEEVLTTMIRERGEEEVRRLLRLRTDESVSLGLIEVTDFVPSGVEVL